MEGKANSGGNDAVRRRVGLVYDERMCLHHTPDGDDHPECPDRIRVIWNKLRDSGLLSRCVLLGAKEVEDRYIQLVHSKSHVDLIKSISSKQFDSRRDRIASKFNSIYFNKGSSEAAYLAAGSVLEVAEKVAKGDLDSGFAIVRTPGHHAEENEPMGFCLFNNVAIAASYLLNERPELGIQKILIVDWDVHHGNATQKMFWKDSRVLFFSVHRHDFGCFYPATDDGSHIMIGEGPGEGYNINVPWEHGRCGDPDYLAVWDHILIPVAKEFNPDMIIVSAGFDAAVCDPLGGCCITPDGYSVMLRKLMDFAHGKVLLALEGGYNLQSLANSAHACVQVLLEGKPIVGSSEAYPFESTWRVIENVRQKLSVHWKSLSEELPKKLTSLKAVPPQSLPPRESRVLQSATMATDLEKKAKEAFIDDHFELAVDLYSQAIDLNPNSAELYADRAQANIKLSNFTEAVADAQKATELDSLMAKAYLRKGIACIKLEEYQTAKIAFQAGAALALEDSRFTSYIKECDQRIAEENANISKPVVDKPTQNAVPAGSNTDPASAVPAPAVNGASNEAGAVKQSKPKFRHEFYQKPEEVVVTIFAKGIPAKSVTVDYGEQILSVTIDIPGEEPYRLQPRLFGKIIPAKCRYEVMSTKIEIRLAKAEQIQWTSLEYTKNVVVAPKISVSSPAQRPSYPSSKTRVTDWDKLEAEVKKQEKEEKLDGDAALNKFFQDIYRDADEDTRRAMQKSFVESNGTVLSTNWKDVGSKKVEGTPPDGMEMKKWEY